MKPLLLMVTLCVAAPVRAQDQLTPTEKKLMDQVERLSARVTALESRLAQSSVPAEANTLPPTPSAAAAPPVIAAVIPGPQLAGPLVGPLAGTTISGALDGYYAFNFNRPIGRDNLLRAFDATSNSFSLNQADLIVENAPDPEHGKRWGARLDLQFGQATQALQGNPANEPRPDIYRNIYQAYGTWVFPLARGLTVDFGKWSSSVGIEGNYSKDQMNYSRSLWFAFLPSYHMGARAAYKFNDQLTFNYWITNGVQQTESFNNFRDELFGFNLTPRGNINWTANYYLGQEHPDVTFYNGLTFNNPPAGVNLPTLQGVPFLPISNPPTGRLHIFDSYVSWQVSPRLSLALEGDDVIDRLYPNSSPSHIAGGIGYARYQLTPKLAIAGRAEYMSDRGGLFSGRTQALKEATFTLEYKLADGFLVREEWRRDDSNQPYFLTDTLGILKKEQNTATMGLVWWFGQRTGTW